IRNARRVAPEQFDFILGIIHDHPVYQYQAKRRQAAFEAQLKVALYRLGHIGFLSSFEAIGRTLGIGAGPAKTYTDSCVDAL
ncbi:hypothetical protein EDD21DRAFT_289915, partial [Dissophora ornata]